jgi:SOS-response transcriptional repressor LexA
MAKTADVDEGFAGRLQKAMDRLHYRAGELADLLNLSAAHMSQMLNGRRSPSDRTLQAASEFLGVRSRWMSHGEEPMLATPNLVSPEDAKLVSDLRTLSPEVQKPLRDLVAALTAASESVRGEPAAVRQVSEPPASDVTVYDLVELRKRGETRVVRLVGDVAALSDPSVAYEDRQGGELADIEIPLAVWCPNCQVVRVRGDSMQDDGLLDGYLLVVKPSEFGAPGRDVVAWTEKHGMVVKRYGGQRRGIIHLESRGDGIPISGKAGAEVQVRAIVEHVYRER